MRNKVKGIDNCDINSINIKIGRKNKFNKKGAALETMTQKKAYDLVIRQKRDQPGGMKTITNTEKIKEMYAAVLYYFVGPWVQSWAIPFI